LAKKEGNYSDLKNSYFSSKMFERETRREKILEARNRELKLKKAKAAGEHDEGEVKQNSIKYI